MNIDDEKLLKWRPDALKNLSGEGLKKPSKHVPFVVAFGVHMCSKKELNKGVF